tara:strand:+ start:215 stop:634 length:420 start_codon:yes stop_codon:yes gene_type:complete
MTTIRVPDPVQRLPKASVQVSELEGALEFSGLPDGHSLEHVARTAEGMYYVVCQESAAGRGQGSSLYIGAAEQLREADVLNHLSPFGGLYEQYRFCTLDNRAGVVQFSKRQDYCRVMMSNCEPQYLELIDVSKQHEAGE